MDPFKPYMPKPRSSTPKLSVDDAQALALRAIAFIMSDDDLASRFVQITGAGIDDLKSRMAEPAFLGAVLDFVLGDEACVLAFAAAEKIAPELPLLARQKLP